MNCVNKSPRHLIWALLAMLLTTSAHALQPCPRQKLEKIDSATLEKILQEHAKWVDSSGWGPPEIPGRAVLCNADLSGLKRSDINLIGADLRGADLSYAILDGIHFDGAQMQNANLFRTSLITAVMRGADLTGANLQGTVMTNGSLEGINLTNTKIFGVDFGGASFFNVTLTNAVFEPAAAPAEGKLTGIKDLLTVRFGLDPMNVNNTSGIDEQISGLAMFRSAFEKAGLKDLERHATYVIERARTRDDLANSNPLIKLGGYVKLIIFEWTTGYGRYPWCVFVIMLGFMIGFAVAYWFALRINDGQNGIFSVYPPGALDTSATPVTPRSGASATLKNPTGWSRIWCAVYFSLISAFRIGWREVNLGIWIEGMQADDFRLTATGWPRTVAGVQSFLSVYLLAIWALTEFGRPFD